MVESAANPDSLAPEPTLCTTAFKALVQDRIAVTLVYESFDLKFSQFSNIQTGFCFPVGDITVKIPSLYTETLGLQHFRQKDEVKSWGAHRIIDTQHIYMYW